MEPKHFNMLAVAAVVSFIAAGVVHGAYNDWSREVVTGKKLFPSLDKNANLVGRIALQKGASVLTLQKKGSGWTLLERAGYPVNGAKVRQLLIDLLSAELVEPKTHVPERYKLLDLEDPAKAGAKSTRVRLSKEKGKVIAEVVLGKRRMGAFGTGKAGTYVRRTDNPQAWLSNVDVRASMDVSDWVDPVFFRLDPNKVISLKFQPPGGVEYSVVADAKKKGTFKIAPLPAGLKLKKGAAPTAMITSMRTLELTDVRKLEKTPAGKAVTPTLLEMASGMKLEIRVLRGKTDRWISFRVVEDGKAKAAAKKIRSKLEGWEFKVADWRLRQTFKEPKDLFAVLKKPAPKLSPKTVPTVAPIAAPKPGAGAGSPKVPTK